MTDPPGLSACSHLRSVRMPVVLSFGCCVETLRRREKAACGSVHGQQTLDAIADSSCPLRARRGCKIVNHCLPYCVRFFFDIAGNLLKNWIELPASFHADFVMTFWPYAEDLSLSLSLSLSHNAFPTCATFFLVVQFHQFS